MMFGWSRLRRHVRFLQEAAPEVVVTFQQAGGQDLERDLAPESGLLGQVDDAHPSAPENRLDAESGDLCADSGA